VRERDGAVVDHGRYDEESAGDKLIASIFPLQSGRYFGPAGARVFMVATLAMPLFAIQGDAVPEAPWRRSAGTLECRRR